MTKITRKLSMEAIENTFPDLFVDSGIKIRKCSACFKEYEPTADDINTRRPSCWFKQCKKCRDRFSLYRRNKQLADVQKYVDSLSNPS